MVGQPSYDQNEAQGGQSWSGDTGAHAWSQAVYHNPPTPLPSYLTSTFQEVSIDSSEMLKALALTSEPRHR